MEQACLDNGISDFGCSLISGGMYFSYLLLVLGIGSMVVLPLINALKTPKDLIKSGAVIGAMVLIFAIAYSLSGDEVTLRTAAMGTTPASSKMIGAGLIMLYVTFLIAIGGLIYSFVNKALK